MGNKLKLNKCSAKPPSVLDSKISATPTSMSATPSSSTSPSTVSPMEPKKNTPSDKTSSPPTPSNMPRSTPTRTTPSPSDTTSCPPGLLRNTKNFSDIKDQRNRLFEHNPQNQQSSQRSDSQTPRTGDPSELSTPSRTKLNAVHAGLSQLLPPWNLLNSSKKVETSNPFPNKSSSPAIPLPTDVVVDGNPTVWNTSPPTVKLPRLNTHTPQEPVLPEPALKKEPQSPSSPRLTPSKDGLPAPSSLPSIKDQSPLPSKPTPRSSKVTPVES